MDIYYLSSFLNTLDIKDFLWIFMSTQKTIYKCLFLLALFFLSLIFFFAKGNNGMDDAEQGSLTTAPLAPSQAEPDVSKSRQTEEENAVSRNEEAPSSLVPKEAVDADSLTLLAIFQANSPLAAAVIHTEGHGAHRYNIGETLPEGGVLAAIHPTEVTIHDNGRQITLRMALMGGGGRTQTDDADNERARDDDGPKMPQHVVDFLNKLDLTPVSEDSPDGYRVGEDFPESGTEEVGVKPGDTIVAINGYPVGEYHSDYLVWLSFKDTRRASVLVENEDGGQFSFHFPEDIKGVSGYVPDG
tara:strand:+ start:6799 stop:7698 length:900 start_codon:yes stop_codon:yes gene_type:complete